jgi:hypothetical protein
MSKPQGKPIGFKTLREIVGYISVNDGNVVKVTVNIVKMSKTDQVDDQGLPRYVTHTAVRTDVLTTEEYQAMVKDIEP